MTLIKTILIILILVMLAVLSANLKNDFVDNKFSKGTFIIIDKVRSI